MSTTTNRPIRRDAYTFEASELGWSPGTWPKRAFLATKAHTGGFDRHSAIRDAEGELLAVRYTANIPGRGPMFVTIIND